MVALIALIAGAMFMLGLAVGRTTESSNRLNVVNVLVAGLTVATFITTLLVPEIP